MVNSTIINQVFIGVVTAAVLMFTNSITDANKEQNIMNNNTEKRLTIIEQRIESGAESIIAQRIINAELLDEVSDIKSNLLLWDRDLTDLHKSVNKIDVEMDSLEERVLNVQNRQEHYINYFISNPSSISSKTGLPESSTKKENVVDDLTEQR